MQFNFNLEKEELLSEDIPTLRHAIRNLLHSVNTFFYVKDTYGNNRINHLFEMLNGAFGVLDNPYDNFVYDLQSAKQKLENILETNLDEDTVFMHTQIVINCLKTNAAPQRLNAEYFISDDLKSSTKIILNAYKTYNEIDEKRLEILVKYIGLNYKENERFRTTDDGYITFTDGEYRKEVIIYKKASFAEQKEKKLFKFKSYSLDNTRWGIYSSNGYIFESELKEYSEDKNILKVIADVYPEKIIALKH